MIGTAMREFVFKCSRYHCSVSLGMTQREVEKRGEEREEEEEESVREREGERE